MSSKMLEHCKCYFFSLSLSSDFWYSSFSVTLKPQISIWLFSLKNARLKNKVRLTLEQTGLNCMGPLKYGLFYFIFLKKYLYFFLSEIGSLWMLRADCMHWPTLFYIGNLSISDFGIWMREMQRDNWCSYTWIFDCEGVGTP